MHLQQIGLITKANGLPYPTYQLAKGLSAMCIKDPALLRLPDDQEKAALSELDRWRQDRLHESFFLQLAGLSEHSWMS